MLDQIILYLLKLVIKHMIKMTLRRCFLVDQLNFMIIEMMRK